MADTEVQNNMESEGLTPGERAYLESGGENADLLREEEKAPAAAQEKPTAETKPKAAAAEPEKKTPSAEAPVVAKEPSEEDEELPKDPKTATVPYQKYQRETKRQKERLAQLEKELRETNEKFTRGDERLKLLTEVIQPPAKEAVDEDPEPDPQKDVFAWVDWSRREQQRLREEIAGTREIVTEGRAEQKMRQDYERDAIAFAQSNPHFPAAYNHLLTTRAATLQAQGYTEQQIGQILHNEERGLVARAFQNNRRPAELIYSMAKSMGFREPAAKPNPDSAASAAEAAPGANGGAAPSQKPASAVEDVERIQRGVEASKSLSGAGGAPQELSIEALGSMSESEFAALYAKKSKEIDKLLGKRAN